MPYVTPEQIKRAKQMDLLTYLQYYEPHELVRFSSNVYATHTHDSLKISNGKWCWWSQGIGGRSALDYLIKVRGMAFTEAVIQIDGKAAIAPPVSSHSPKLAEPRKLLLLEKNANNNRVITYLTGRGIHSTLIDYCIQTGQLYESRPITMRSLLVLTSKVRQNMQPSGEPQNGDIWEKPMVATSITLSPFHHVRKAQSCTCLKVQLTFYLIAH